MPLNTQSPTDAFHYSLRTHHYVQYYGLKQLIDMYQKYPEANITSLLQQNQALVNKYQNLIPTVHLYYQLPSFQTIFTISDTWNTLRINRELKPIFDHLLQLPFEPYKDNYQWPDEWYTHLHITKLPPDFIQAFTRYQKNFSDIETQLITPKKAGH